MKDYTDNELTDIVCEFNDDFEVIETNITDANDGDVSQECIVKEISTGKFYCINYTDNNEWGMEMDDGPFEVKPVEKLVTVYEPVVE
jgi:hypothetical protein